MTDDSHGPRFWRRAAGGLRWISGAEAAPTVDPDPYKPVEPRARRLKARVQMVIGVVAVLALAIHFLVHWIGPGLPSLHKATTTLLGGIGTALAAAAVVELAYTLFTSGPDEALDPLMLGLAAGLLLLVGGLEPGISFGQAAALLVLGILLAGLFATRLWLAEDPKKAPPDVWWIRGHLERRTPEASATTDLDPDGEA